MFERENTQPSLKAAILIPIGVIGFAIGFFAVVNLVNNPASNPLHTAITVGVANNIITNSINNYNMCLRNNDLIGASVQAAVISNAYMEIGNEEGYRKWYQIEQDLMNKRIIR